jgi:hypothetical protein
MKIMCFFDGDIYSIYGVFIDGIKRLYLFLFIISIFQVATMVKGVGVASMQKNVSVNLKKYDYLW